MTSANKKGSSGMRVAVLGAGAVGGYLGGLLAHAGTDVTLIARGEQLRAIQSNGLRVHSEGGDFTVQVRATERTDDVGPVDLVLFTVKTYQTQEAVRLLRPLLADGTTVLTLQNGAGRWTGH